MTNQTNKTKLVVIGEHTLGYILPNSTMAGVLHASILKGATFTVHNEPLQLPRYNETVRLATPKDFDEFRVSFEGFNNPSEYEYDNK